MNSFKVFALMTGLIILFGFIGLYFGGTSGLILALTFALILNLTSFWYSDKLVIKLFKAKAVLPGENQLLMRIVNKVAIHADNMPLPKVYIVPTKSPNAFATGRNVDHAAICVTQGLLELLSEDELEGVISHEFAHILNNDILLGTITATMVGAISILVAIARWGAIFGGLSKSNDRGGGLSFLALLIVTPLVAMILQSAISRQREFKADYIGAKLTGKNYALADALEKLHQAPNRLNLDARPGTASMMIINPITGRGLSRFFSTHPPVAERTKRLRKQTEEFNYLEQ